MATVGVAEEASGPGVGVEGADDWTLLGAPTGGGALSSSGKP